MKRPTNHNHHRRASFHDYHTRGTYLLTIVIAGRRPLLGHLVTPPPPASPSASPSTSPSATNRPPVSPATSLVATNRPPVSPSPSFSVSNRPPVPGLTKPGNTKTITRAQCLELNHFAELLAQGDVGSVF